MRVVHLANTDFEFELSRQPDELPGFKEINTKKTSTIEDTWNRFPICLQLQFIPLLFAEEQDAVAVTHLPDSEFIDRLNQCLLVNGKKKLPDLVLISDSTDLSSYDRCESWGASASVKKWAKSRALSYSIPDREIVKMVNSKSFSLSESPFQESFELLRSEEDLREWLGGTREKRVIKTCFGMSGRGHYFIGDTPSFSSVLNFCLKEWECGRPVIGELWLDRIFDFSTQWYLDPVSGIKLMGSTVFKNNSKGVYEST